MTATTLRSVALLALWGAPLLPAQDVAGSQDHPLLSRFPGSRIVYYSLKDFDSYVLPLSAATADGVAAKVDTVQGKVTRIGYELAPTSSVLQVYSSYQAALTAAGFVPAFQCSGQAAADSCGPLHQSIHSLHDMAWSTEEDQQNLVAHLGNSVYVVLHVSEGHALLDITEVKPLVAGLVTAPGVAAAASAPGAPQPPYTSGGTKGGAAGGAAPVATYGFTLDGVTSGSALAVSGGGTAAEVIFGPGTQKRLGAVAYDPLLLEVDPGSVRPLWQWVRDAWLGKSTARDGVVYAADLSGRTIFARRFRNARVAAVAFPALDPGSAQPAAVTLELAVENVETSRTDGGTPGKYSNPATPATTFRLGLPGLDAAAVTRVEAFTVTLERPPATARQRNRGALVPPPTAHMVVVPNLEVTLLEAAADTWRQWFEDFAVRGKSSGGERNGRLVLLAADGRTAVLALGLQGVGIAALRPAAGAPGRPPLLKATLYVQRMDFEP